MAAELITPMDEMSGIPLPILPQEYLPMGKPDIANWHHPWHAESAPELQGLGGKALRHSRVQLVRATDHNMGDKRRGKLTYHDFFVGPPLPTTDDERFRLCVISAAGYVPDEAIDLRGDEPKITFMDEAQIELLRMQAQPRRVQTADVRRLERRAARDFRSLRRSGGSKRVQEMTDELQQKYDRQASFGLHHVIYQYQPMRDFFRKHVAEQGLENIPETTVEEFLRTPQQVKKEQLGSFILKTAVEQTTDPVRSQYQNLRLAGKLHPSMPDDARDLVLYKLGNWESRQKLAERWGVELGRRLGIPA